MAIAKRALGQKLRLQKHWQILLSKPFDCFSTFSFYKAEFRVYNIDTVYYYI